MRDLASLWPALLGMALVTYATRIGGLWIVSLATDTPRLARVLQHLATGVLTSLVVAGLADSEAAISPAVAGAIILMRVTGNLMAAIAGAAAIAAAVRAIG